MNKKIVFFPINHSNYPIYFLLKKHNYNVYAYSFVGSGNVGKSISSLVNSSLFCDVILDISDYENNESDILFLSEVTDVCIRNNLFESLLEKLLNQINHLIYFGDNDRVRLLINKNNLSVNSDIPNDYSLKFKFYPNSINQKFIPTIPTIFVLGCYENYEQHVIGLLIKKHFESCGFKVLCYINSKDSKLLNAFPYSPSFMNSKSSPSDQINELNEWFRYYDEIVEPDINICIIPHGLNSMEDNYNTTKGIYMDMIKNILNPNTTIMVLSDIDFSDNNLISQIARIELHLGKSIDYLHGSNAVYSGISNQFFRMKPMYITQKNLEKMRMLKIGSRIYHIQNLLDEGRLGELSNHVIEKYTGAQGDQF